MAFQEIAPDLIRARDDLKFELIGLMQPQCLSCPVARALCCEVATVAINSSVSDDLNREVLDAVANIMQSCQEGPGIDSNPCESRKLTICNNEELPKGYITGKVAIRQRSEELVAEVLAKSE